MQELKFTWSKLTLCSVPIVLCLTIPMVLMYLCALEAASPQGTGSPEFLLFAVLSILTCLLILPAFILSCVGLAYPRWRLYALVCLASIASLFVGCLAGGSISNHVQKATLTKLAERSKPLVAAIKSYEQRNGHPPDSLDTLVPEFISRVPATGIGASPDYQYQSLTNNSSYGDNKWVLQVNEPAGSPPFTTFIYLPLQDYSVLTYGFVVWRIGDWAYWHQG